MSSTRLRSGFFGVLWSGGLLGVWSTVRWGPVAVADGFGTTITEGLIVTLQLLVCLLLVGMVFGHHRRSPAATSNRAGGPARDGLSGWGAVGGVILSGVATIQLGVLYAVSAGIVAGGVGLIVELLVVRLQEGDSGEGWDPLGWRTKQQLRRLEARIDEYRDVAAESADGDLGQRMTPAQHHDGAAALAKSYNKLLGEIQSAILQVQHFTTTVQHTTAEITQRLEGIHSEYEVMVDVVEGIEMHTDDQQQILTESSTDLQTVESGLEHCLTTIDRADELADDILHLATDGSEQGRDLRTDLGYIEQDIEAIAESLATLCESVNADASPDTEGTASASVASRLSDVSTDLQTLQSDVRTAIEEIGDIVSLYDEIRLSHISESKELDQAIETLEEQQATIESVVDSVDDVSAIATTTARRTETIADRTETHLVELRGTRSQSQALSTRADQLSEALAWFTIDDASSPSRRDQPSALPPENGGSPSLESGTTASDSPQGEKPTDERPYHEPVTDEYPDFSIDWSLPDDLWQNEGSGEEGDDDPPSGV